MPQRRLYSERLEATLSGSAPFYLHSERTVAKGFVRFITSAHAIDKTTDDVEIAFGKMVGTEFVYMEAQEATDDAVGFFTRNTHHFIANEKATFYFADGAADDSVEAYLEGYEVEQEQT